MARRRRHNFRPKGSTSSRGYGSTHQATRKLWDPVVQTSAVDCVRCGLPIEPGTPWHLDHRDDRGGYLGPAHATCNLRAAAQLGNARMREKRALEESFDLRRVQSREW